MRNRSANDELSVHAIAGTEIVLLGLNVTESAAEGLLGFTIYRGEGNSGRKRPLRSGQTFENVQSIGGSNTDRSASHLVQSFMWGDYTVEPQKTYSYTVIPQYGRPGHLKSGMGVEVSVTTEAPDDGVHAIHFNRGTAGSAAYGRRFQRYGKWYLEQPSAGLKKKNPQPTAKFLIKPEDVPKGDAYKWLSRGLEEAMLGFIQQAQGPEYSLRAAVYEFTYQPVIRAFVQALERGVDVKIVHHAARQTIRHERPRGPNEQESGVESQPEYQHGVPHDADIEEPLSRKLEDFQTALLDGYRTRTDLEIMLRFGLDWRLNEIVSEHVSLIDSVFKLLEWAESKGKLGALLLAALRRNADNPKLKRIKNAVLPEKAPPAPARRRQDVVEEKVPDSVCQAALAAVSQIGLSHRDHLAAFSQMMIERRNTTISHNKFIILLKNGEPVEVWTGSTGFTAGAIFGQSNVGHIVHDAKVARKYLQYWNKLATDPKKLTAKSDADPDAGMRNWNIQNNPDLAGKPPRRSTVPVFSPRLTKNMLDWYADRMASAKNSVFFIAPFSISQPFFKILSEAKPTGPEMHYLRYVLLESRSGLMRDKFPVMAQCPQNRIAWGDRLRRWGESEEHYDHFIDALTGLNDYVMYVNARLMLVDPLSDDPLVIAGSANFSETSIRNNDENMLIIRGDARVADIYLTEFMRAFQTFHGRNRANAMSDDELRGSRFLTPDDSWTKPYFTEGTQEYNERLLFA